MFTGRYFAGRYFAPRYFPREQVNAVSAATFPCPQALVYALLVPRARVSRLPAPVAGVACLLSPTAEIRGC